MFCSWSCTASRFWLLCRSLGYPIPYRRSLELALSIEFGVAATPGGLGGTAIFLTLLRQEGIPLPTGTSIWLADLASDAFFFAAFSPIAIFFMLRNWNWSGFFQGLEKPHLIGVLVVLSLFCGFMMWAVSKCNYLERIEALTERYSFARRRRIPARLRLLRWRYLRSVRQIRTACFFLWRQRKSILLVNLMLAAGQWFARYGLLPCILAAFSINVSPWPLILIQGILMTSSLFFILPGGGGSVEVAMAVLLGHFVPLSLAGVIVILWRFFTYHLNLMVGGIVFFRACQRLHSPSSGSFSMNSSWLSGSPHDPSAIGTMVD